MVSGGGNETTAVEVAPEGAASAGVVVAVAAAEADAAEVMARVLEAGGASAERVEAAGVEPAAIAETLVRIGAAAVVLDLAGGNLAVVEALRARPEPAAAACRVLVFSAGPANGRLLWNAGVDALLQRPLPASDLAAAVTSSLAVAGDDRAAVRSAGLAALSA